MDTKQYDLIVIDTETTGIDNAQVLQLSIIDKNGIVLFNEYFKPRGIKQWHQAEKIHGISYEMVKDKHTFKFYQKQVQQIFDNATTIVGYNVWFDIGMIATYIDTSKNNIVDVMQPFSELYGEINQYYGTYKWQKLTTATKYFNYDWSQHGKPHGALADAYATLFVYQKLNEMEEAEKQPQR